MDKGKIGTLLDPQDAGSNVVAPVAKQGTNHFLSLGKSYGAEVDWMDSTLPEVALWEKMRANPNEWVEGILPLRMLNSAKTALK